MPPPATTGTDGSARGSAPASCSWLGGLVLGTAVLAAGAPDRQSPRLNYTLSLHDVLPIYATTGDDGNRRLSKGKRARQLLVARRVGAGNGRAGSRGTRSAEPTAELHSFPTRRSSDLCHHRRRREPTAQQGEARPPAARGSECWCWERPCWQPVHPAKRAQTRWPVLRPRRGQGVRGGGPAGDLRR